MRYPAKEVKEQFLLYVSGRLPLSDFEEWLWRIAGEVHRDQSPEAYDMAGRAMVAVAEYDRGDRTEEQVRAEVARALVPRTQSANLGMSPVRLATSQREPQQQTITLAAMG
jgi:hypothetical protein